MSILKVQGVNKSFRGLRALNDVSLNQVMEVTANALDAGLLQYSPGSVIGTGGHIETPNQRLSIQHVLPITTPKDLAEITPNLDVNSYPNTGNQTSQG